MISFYFFIIFNIFFIKFNVTKNLKKLFGFWVKLHEAYSWALRVPSITDRRIWGSDLPWSPGGRQRPPTIARGYGIVLVPVVSIDIPPYSLPLQAVLLMVSWSTPVVNQALPLPVSRAPLFPSVLYSWHDKIFISFYKNGSKIVALCV